MLLWTIFAALVVCARGAETWLSARRSRARLRAGANEHAPGQYRATLAVHFGLLPAMATEIVWWDRPLIASLAWGAGTVVVAATALRWWAILTLGRYWSHRILISPGTRRVTDGPYRFVPHPGYLAMGIDVPAFALTHTAWITAAVFGTANLLWIAARVRTESRALAHLT
ncbi:isoprenylcysteine carboxylmethyltransferase family protein [Streptomyces sp. HD]|uniref:isoprenylcysteine carboxylmethyltransferase family protein n=1 Tax=Streptomyces sp. HD TaxID=3020892 RepID=UPI002330F407|nr:isoprenylcysteine carboxylmethyltransferase family protein [Streptomyces sp. HD]MDC0770738.1 isoprenylcysteine carboxylmethyltransferase family protein [Streptomyces sp. HD]